MARLGFGNLTESSAFVRLALYGEGTMSVEITHIRLSGTSKLHEHITSYKWKNVADSTTGTSDKPTMVDWIDKKSGSAYVGGGAGRANVGTVHPDGSLPYLRTYADGKWSNNLRSLPTF